MTYSFVKPRIKPILSLFSRVWLAFIVLGAAFIIGISFYYRLENNLILTQLNEKKQELTRMQNQSVQNEEEFEFLSAQKDLAYATFRDNEELKNSLNNLFELIRKTGGVRLDELKIGENSLEIKGIVPTKNMFILLLETPLKSTFDESTTTFYELNNGWYRFVNVNTRNIGAF